MDEPRPPVELTITFLPSAGGLKLRWESDVFGAADSEFTPPYQGDELELVIRGLDHLQFPTGGLVGSDLERLAMLGLPIVNQLLTDRAHQVVGQALFRALTTDSKAMRVLYQVRDSAMDKDVPLTIRLRFPPNGSALALLPWELLWDDEENPFLLRGKFPVDCTRHLDLNEAIPPTRPSPVPLRILPIVPHAGVAEKQRLAEREARQQAWQPLIDQGLAVVLHEVSPATPRTIGDALRSGPAPDIIHYVGHGAYFNGSGRLLLDNDDGGRRATPINKLRPLLGNARMVVLTACQSGTAGSTEEGVAPFNGVAPALSAVGVSIVIAMQLTVRAEAANRATCLIYQALAHGKSVQVAVGEARQALYAEEVDGASWYVPTLYIRSREAGPLYLTAGVMPTAELVSSRETALRAEAQRREAERQEVERNRRDGGPFYALDFFDVDPVFPQIDDAMLGDQPPEVIAITGNPGSGRTTALELFYAKRPRSPGLTIEHTAPIYLSAAGQENDVGLLLAIGDALRQLLLQLCYRDEALIEELGSENFDLLLTPIDTDDPLGHNLEFLVAMLDRLRCSMLVICIDNVPQTIEPEELFLRLNQVVRPKLWLYLRMAYAGKPPRSLARQAHPAVRRTRRRTKDIRRIDLSWSVVALTELFAHLVPRTSGLVDWRDQVLRLVRSPSDLKTWLAVFDDEQYPNPINSVGWERLLNAMNNARANRPDRHLYQWTLSDWHQARMILAQEGATV